MAGPDMKYAFLHIAASLDNIYYTIESERLDWVLRHNLPASALMLGREVKAVSPRLVVLDGAQRINAGGVIDARGGSGDLQPS